jgi:aminopeptidase N
MRRLPLASLALAACATPARMAPVAPAVAFTTSRYDVRLTPDLKSKRVHGQTTLHLDAAATGTIEFAVPDLDIEHVELSGKPVLFQVTQDHLRISIPAGAHALQITYQGRAQRGLFFGPDYLYSDYSSCGWMICNDEPGEKAEFELELEVPRGTVVVASGKWVDDLPGSTPELFKSHWHQTTGYAPYLFGFAAGAFAQASLGPLRLYGAGETPATLLAKLRDTPRMVQFFESKAGTPLPTSDYAQIVVADEAQEKSSFSLIGKEELDPILTDPKEDWVIAHELAHQWWGNSITCKTWPHPALFTEAGTGSRLC